MSRAFTVGLTGGIASGKSSVEAEFRALGVPVMDADAAARAVVEPGTPGLAAIIDRFGPGIVDSQGRLDRRALRERVFADIQARRDLETITHPAIRAHLRQWRDAQTAPYCMLSVPLLVEGESMALVDRVLVVDAPLALQLRRLMQRDGVDEALARRMIAAQASREQRLAHAHEVLLNDADPAHLRREAARLHRQYLDLAQLSKSQQAASTGR